MVMCVRGGQVGRPQAVWPLVKEGGKTWIHATEHLQWLRKATSSAGTTHYNDRFQSATTAMRLELKEALKLHRRGADSDQAKLRASLGLADMEGKQRPSSKRARPPPASAVDDLVVQVALGKHVVNVRNELRPLLIEATIPNANAMLEFFFDHPAAGVVNVKKTSSAKAKDSLSMHKDRCARIIGNIGWHPSHAAWNVTYKDKDGKVCRHHVKVASYMPKSETGTTLVSYEDGRRDAWAAACGFWNGHDHSTKARIDAHRPGLP